MNNPTPTPTNIAPFTKAAHIAQDASSLYEKTRIDLCVTAKMMAYAYKHKEFVVTDRELECQLNILLADVEAYKAATEQMTKEYAARSFVRAPSNARAA